jgi:transcriptional regulator with XRE-family HTH domain
MTVPGSPTVRRRRLAAELRRIRDRRGDSLQAVAGALRWSTSKLSRYELGKGGLRPSEVASLLDHYQVSGARRAQLLELAADASQKGWWEEYSDVSNEEYQQFIGLEAEASSIKIWHIEVVTGLLQAERYARSILSDYNEVEPTAPSIIERRLQLRMQRQEHAFRREPPLELVVVLDESALLRRIGDESVMFEQLERLAAEADRPNMTLRILPLSARHSVFADSFVIFRFGPEGDAILHDVAATEGLRASFYVEGEQETHLYRRAFDILLDASLDAAASKRLIIQAQSRWGLLWLSMIT